MSKTLTEAISLNYSDGNKGLLINPFMEFSQERGTTSTVITSAYMIDQWFAEETSSGVLTMQKISNPFSINSGFKKFRDGLNATATTAAASYSSTDFFVPYRQPIEGLFWKDLGWGTTDAKDIDIVLVLSSTVTGTYALSIRNGAVNRSYVTTFNLIANTPTIVFKTIPGDITGTWNIDNSSSSIINICSVGGTTLQAPTLDAWQAGSYFTHSSATNWAVTLNATITLGYANIFPKGIIPFKLASDTGFLDTIFALKNDYDRELLKCQRYYSLIGVNIRGSAEAAHTMACTFYTPVEMRVIPTMTYISGSSASNVSSLVMSAFRKDSGMIQATTIAAGEGYFLDYLYSANARM